MTTNLFAISRKFVEAGMPKAQADAAAEAIYLAHKGESEGVLFRLLTESGMPEGQAKAVAGVFVDVAKEKMSNA